MQDSNQSCKEIGSIHLLFMIKLRSVIDPKEVTRWIKIQRNVYLNNMHFFYKEFMIVDSIKNYKKEREK